MSEAEITVVAVRALVPEPGNDHAISMDGHWLTSTRIANPMSAWPAYREDRASWGLDALGLAVVEVETSDGHVGVAPTLGGLPITYIVEHHLARFVEGRALTRDAIVDIWQQMFRASLYYGRRGLAVHALSAIDLALWDVLGKALGRPVWSLAGTPVQRELAVYATGPRPDIARALGFKGGKLPVPASASEGDDGHDENVELFRRMRAACGPREEFFLAYDAYMSLDVPSAKRLGEALRDDGLLWLEEPLLADDYAGYAALRRHFGGTPMVTGGEHEATRWGFEQLLDGGCVDILQPEPTWSGGFTACLEALDLAVERGIDFVPHGSGPYAYHLAVLSPRTPYVEFAMLHPQALEPVPVYAPLLVGDPLPVDGVIAVGDEPGFGMHRDPAVPFTRPFPERG